MTLNETLQYLKEELTDISIDKQLYHYTNIPALTEIIKSGGLIGGRNFVSLNEKGKNLKQIIDSSFCRLYNQELTDVKELCTTRQNLKTPPKNKLSHNADNVKFILYPERIISGIRGVKKTAPTDLPGVLSKQRDRLIQDFREVLKDHRYKEDRPVPTDSEEHDAFIKAVVKKYNKELFNLTQTKKYAIVSYPGNFSKDTLKEFPQVILKETEKYIDEKYPDITKSTRTAKIKNVVNHIYHYYRGLRHELVRKNKPVFQRGLNSFASEERFNLGDKKIPLDSKFMKIEFLGPPAKEWLLGQQTNFHSDSKEKYKFDPQAAIDAIKSLPDDLVIKNKGYYDNLNFLENMVNKKE